MKLSLSLKSIFRSPVRSILTFVLFCAVSFAFFMRVGEYAVTRREFNNAASQYRGVGAAEAAPIGDMTDPSWKFSKSGMPYMIMTDPRIASAYPDEFSQWEWELVASATYKPVTREQIAAISGLPQVTFTDFRYMTAGVSDDFYRLYEGSSFYAFTSRCIVEATLVEVQTPGQYVDGLGRINRVLLEDCKILAGNTPLIDENGSLVFGARSDKVTMYASLGSPQYIVCRYTPNYIYDTDYQQTFTPGDRHVFVLIIDPLFGTQEGGGHLCFALSDFLVNPWCEPIWSVEGEPDNYLELEKFSALRTLVDLTNADDHTFDVVYTEDMRAILRFSEGDMMITEGRVLTREDNECGAPVCVISSDLAAAYGLGIGDTITLNRGTMLFEQNKGLGALAVTKERYSPPEKEVTLEIVGLYTDTDSFLRQSVKPHWSYSVNTVFVPKFLLPVDESTLSDHEFSPAEVTFVIENAWDIPAFLEAAEPLFEELGLRLIFDDGGWLAIVDDFIAAQRLSLINIAVFSAAILMATCFTVYLFILRNKKEYAIMRALGTPKRKSALALVVPLMTVVTVSIIVGSDAAWFYSVKTIERNNTLQNLRDYAVDASIPTAVILGCIFGELLLTALIALVMLRRISAKPPLALLQWSAGSAQQRKRKIKSMDVGRGVPDAPFPVRTDAMSARKDSSVALLSQRDISEGRGVSDAPFPARTAPDAPPANPIGFVLRYIGKHVRRSAWKSALVLILAALLYSANAEFVLLRRSYDDLFNNTVITARVLGGLAVSTAVQLAGSEYTSNPYYETVGTVDADFETVRFVFTNNIPRFTAREEEEEVEIVYADGYDESCMESFGDVIIVGRTFLEEHGLAPGDSVVVTSSGLSIYVKSDSISRYRRDNPDSGLTDDEIYALREQQIRQTSGALGIRCKIAGVVSTPSGRYGSMIFSPGTYSATMIAMPGLVDMAEYTIADNELIDEFREVAARIIGGSATDGNLIMDTSKIESIRSTRRLLNALYPMAVTAALLIGAFLCCLIIHQSSKEAAIMRLLGTSKLKARTMLSLEQAFLSAAGLIIGVCVTLTLRRQGYSALPGAIPLFASLYIAIVLASSAACSALVTRRSALELLQTKE